MAYVSFTSSYTRIDPDGTFHRWENKLQMIGSVPEIRQLTDHFAKRSLIPSIGTLQLPKYNPYSISDDNDDD